MNWRSIPLPMRTLVRLATLLLHFIRALFRSREEQAILNLALQQQLAVYAQKRLCVLNIRPS
jgi:hypothetical protein